MVNGKDSKTHVRVLSTYPVVPSNGSPDMLATAVELTPITGRTHQLRVHMAHSGYPMLGDTLYASPSVMSASPRLELHAHTIRFLQPSTKEEVCIEAPILLSPHVCPPEGFSCLVRRQSGDDDEADVASNQRQACDEKTLDQQNTACSSELNTIIIESSQLGSSGINRSLHERADTDTIEGGGEVMEREDCQPIKRTRHLH